MIIERVTLCGKYATGYKNGELVPATYLWRNDACAHDEYIQSQDRLDGNTVSLVNIWSHNYFHWILENLTQLISLDEIDNVLVPPNYPEYVFESLEFLGLTDKICNWIGIPTEVNLLTAGQQRRSGYSELPALKKVIDRFRKVNGNSPRYIYISRTDTGSRRVLNEKTYLDKVLYNYQRIVPSKLSLLEQAEYFSNAKHIIGPHGAGLTNMIWSPEVKVTELVGSYENPCFKKLAITLGREYELVKCRPMGADMFAEV
ncbi:MAG: glycosyltransferase family 61 protein [bacterium]